MQAKILDAHGLMVFLEKEPGYEKVKALFVSAVEKKHAVLMTSVNWGEVYYIVLREMGARKAEEIEKVIGKLPIEVVDVDVSLAKEAAMLKAFHKMSYADCFAAALAKLHNGELTTGDKEFKSLEREIKINWLP